MIVNFHELDHGFHLEFTPEDMEDQAILVRFGLNATKERIMMGTSVEAKSGIHAWISISKRKLLVRTIKA